MEPREPERIRGINGDDILLQDDLLFTDEDADMILPTPLLPRSNVSLLLLLLPLINDCERTSHTTE